MRNSFFSSVQSVYLDFAGDSKDQSSHVLHACACVCVHKEGMLRHFV